MGVQERRQREREARRSSVLDATRSLLLELGFNGTTTKQIAARCELSEATLFFSFQNKDEIFLSLLFEGIDFTGRFLDELIAAELNPRQKLERLWRFYSEINDEHPEYVHLFGYLSRPQATKLVTDEVRDKIARRTGDNFRRLAAIFAEAVGRRRARLVADLMWGSFIGLMTLKDTRGNLGAPVHPDPTELAAAFEILMTGIGATLDEGEAT
ncbi:MAG: TetR/AcrR family transcriptional regulator [Alphaproteobacteria bacterium]|nr:TetR/AcrR family transcriptional regulator [Alphaproteobacteria bacterium]